MGDVPEHAAALPDGDWVGRVEGRSIAQPGARQHHAELLPRRDAKVLLPHLQRLGHDQPGRVGSEHRGAPHTRHAPGQERGSPKLVFYLIRIKELFNLVT